MLVLTVAVIAGALELFVSQWLDDGMQYDLEMWKYARSLKAISENPRIGHEHRPDARADLMGVDVKINRLGHRDDEIETVKPKGRFRILMLGDSVTFGWGVPQDQTFAQVLEQRFRAEGIDAEVINTGVGNYNTTMEVESFFAHSRKLDPDVVILNYFINDAEPIPSYENNWLERHSKAWVYFASRIDAAWRHVGLGQKTDWRDYYRHLYDSEANPNGWPQVVTAIEHLSSHCVQQDISLFVVQYPELRQLRPYPFEAQHRMVRDLAERLGVPYLDLLNSVGSEEPSSLWVTAPDPHPNIKANLLFGDALYKWLSDQPPMTSSSIQ